MADQAMMARLTEKATSIWKYMLYYMDVDGNGMIDTEEFKTFFIYSAAWGMNGGLYPASTTLPLGGQPPLYFLSLFRSELDKKIKEVIQQFQNALRT